MDYQHAALELKDVIERFFLQREKDFDQALELILRAFRSGNKLMAFGNGGSASQAQHFAAELVGRFQKERVPFPAIALTSDTSLLTALANDYSYEMVFHRQVEGLSRPGDVVFGLTTSGRSPNVVAAFKKAREMQLNSIALTGKGGADLAPLVDVLLAVPSEDTPRVQEAHLFLIHLLAHEIEKQKIE
jgi:D-sedoheptulose 7-phosphate isomerase